jgi:cytochrome c oxidase assembly protein subunit 11
MVNTHRSTVGKHLLIVVAMFGFGWAMVPLYDLLCDVTGLGGRTDGPYVYDPEQLAPDTSRLVRITFLANTNDGMPWEFWAEKAAMRVHPGEAQELNFHVRNPTDRTMVAQAIPSLIPIRATDHVHKTECFCFAEQELGPGETMAMPLRFIIDPALAPNVDAITLSYALFDITDRVSR